MRLSVPKSSLLWSVQHSYAVASRKASLPILTNLLVRGKETGRVHLAATDLYLGIKTECDAQVEEGGTLAVGARTLYDIVKNMPEGEIHLQSKGAHQLEISCGRVRYCITTLTADDFPPLPNPEDANFFELPAQPLSRLIAQTSFAMSNDDTRPHLAAALLEIQGATMRMVATDGHRMAKAECTISGEVPEAELLMLVPHKGIHELKKMTDGSKSSRQSGAPTHVRVAQHGGLAFFQQQNLELSVKLVDGGFPPYDKIIPKEQNKRVVVDVGLRADIAIV
ncbi:MAG: DNA polymerase III subunit beta, partial [Polyangiales bacterium]